jgi:hypothetical protein
MMQSAGYDIVTELLAVLQNPPLDAVPAARVFRDMMDAKRAGDMPCLVIETGDEPEPIRDSFGAKSRVAQIEVTVLATGSDPYGQCDAALCESFNRIFYHWREAGGFLNGRAIDILEGETRRQRDGFAEDLAAITKIYNVEYRTAEDSLEPI